MSKNNSLIGKMVKHRKPPGEIRVVEIMAIADGYAMVRRPGCTPYVAPMKEIEI